MQYPKENPELLKSMAQVRDNRRWWQKLDQWIEDHVLWLAILLLIGGGAVIVHHWSTFQ